MGDPTFEEIREHLPVVGAGGEPSHLAVRLRRPPGGGRSRFAFLYLHGFGSAQSGEKADFFRERAVADGIPFCSFDFQGHGESGGTMRDLTFSRNLEDLGAVHDFLAGQGLGASGADRFVDGGRHGALARGAPAGGRFSPAC